MEGLPDDPKPYFEVLRKNRPISLGFLSEAQVKESFDDMRKYEIEHAGKRAYSLPRALRKLYGVECGDPISDEEKFRLFAERHGRPPDQPFIRFVR